MQTFDVSANILNDRLVVSAARPKLKATHGTPAAEEVLHVEQPPAAGGLGQCVRARFNDVIPLALLQLLCCVVLFLVLTDATRVGANFVLGVGLLATPLAAVYVVKPAPSLPLLWLLLAHDALVLLFSVMTHSARLDFKFVLGVGLLATPLATVHLCNGVRAAPPRALIYLLLVHDTLVLAALAA